MKSRLVTWCLLSVVVVSAPTTTFCASRVPKHSVNRLVQVLGYGGAIHNFKNYVLRGEEKYRSASANMFDEANTVLESAKASDGIGRELMSAIEATQTVVKAYQAKLPIAQRMWKQKETVEQIDEAVTVDDSPAVAALATLREGHEWSRIEDLDFHIGYGTGIHNFKNFVLRADDAYRARAALGLSKALLIVARYRGSDGVTAPQKKALDKIESVLRAYEEALTRVHALIGEGKSAKEIDSAVKVDDSPALQGLKTLRGPS